MSHSSMKPARWICIPVAALVAACGGSGSGGAVIPGSGSCGADSQKAFVRDVTNDWYLFPELLPAQVNTSSYPTAQDLLDAMTATARVQGKDRFFSYVTTRQADSSFLQEGEFIGFGFRIRVDGSRAYFLDAFESSPASEAGLSRGAELLAVNSGSGWVSTATVLATDPNLSNAFGPSDVGVQRGLRFSKGGVTTDANLTKRVVTITPIPTGGVATLNLPSNPSVEVGYINLRSYISTADAPLRSAFNGFRSQGIQNFIIDLRYNGGGLVSVAELLGDLFGRDRTSSDVYSNLRFSARHASNDTTHRFQAQAQSVAPVSIAFITTGASASASEMTINAMKPWANVAIVGADTYGKPVGQSAFDQTGCDTRLRLVTFRGTNKNEEGDYYNGLAATLPFACSAIDDVSRAMNDPLEASVTGALYWFEHGACSQIMAPRSVGAQKLAPGVAESRYPVPERASVAQVHLPGLF